MASIKEEALKDLKEQLVKIKENNREKIHLLTLMADDYSQYAEDVVNLIVSHIKELPGELKLFCIYAMDSIIKFSGDAVDVYRRFFGAQLVDLFVDTFRQAPIAHRQNLYKVRATWQTIFLKSVLFKLDTELKKIDPAWPITKTPPVIPTSNGASLVGKKDVEKKPETSKEPETTLPKTVPVIEPIAPKSTPASITLNTKSSTSMTKSAIKSNTLNNTKITPLSNKSVVPLGTNTSLKPALKAPISKVTEVQTKAANASSMKPTLKAKAPVVKMEVNEESSKSEPKPKSTAQIAVNGTRILESNENRPKKSRKAVDPRTKSKSAIPEKKRRVDESIQPPLVTPIPQPLPPPQVRPTAALGAHAFLPPPLVNLPPPVVVPKIEVDDSWRSGPRIAYPPQIINNGPPTLPPPSITNETPKVGANMNNRIFVDGRAYEVLHVNNEAVIEQNGLPHRIFFSGPPREILIDGQPYRLGFDETQMINIDGVMHPVRFGAPSRELYVGEHPFRGAFNGPPMIANINGRRHEFRLCGPPPEVRIDKDPSYELQRHMSAVRAPQSSAPKNEDSKLGSDVTALLKKLKQQGLLNSLTKPEAQKPSVSHKPSSAPRIDVIGTAKEIHASPFLKDFHIGSLMVRYQEVVDALHRPRTACSYCGIGFKDINSGAYRNHIDMHVQDLLKTKETGKSRSRNWFMTLDEWMAFDEVEEVQKDPAADVQKHQDGTSPDPSATSPSDAIASTSLNKVCTVCHEKFEEYYDNDEEEWRFKDCVVKGNVAIHRYCIEQMEDGNNANATMIKQEVNQTAFPV